MIEEFNECKLCPRNCKINRNKNEIGYCKANNEIKIAKFDLHFYEEPCISGKNGSGTIFFSGCNLNCKFCQNYKISQEGKGEKISVEKLSEIMIELQEKGANNINLVTGFMFVPLIIESIKKAKIKGLKIPIVYNTSGYENIDTLKLLNGYIDIYLPDFKYYYDDLAFKLSGINNYFEVCKCALKEMINQQPHNIYDENGILKKGVIIRHLVLPNHIQNSKQVLKWIKKNMPSSILVSVMAQYFPSFKANEYNDISRKLNSKELDDIEEFVYKLKIKNVYIQNLE